MEGAPIDRYVVLEHLSEGGMGAIYVGKKLGAGGFEMEVVLKQLLPEFTQQEEFIDLFLREAKLSATLDHANIVHTIDLVTAGGEYFIVMEYLAGGDLRTLLKRAKRRGRRFSIAASIRIAREVLGALAYAHVKRDFDGKPLRLIHRDVSPSNILISHAGEVKLTDFGIAKAATHTSLFYKVKGKIGYMSPEQAKSEPLDQRSDLYSLAVCLYEVLTGERLFVHAGITTSADEIYSQPVPAISKKVPGVPADLDAIMKRALALNPAARFQTAGELNEALTRCAHRNGLLMSAPELAAELRDACGAFDQWRSEDDEDDDLERGDQKRAGTEVYDIAEDEDDDEEDALAAMPSRFAPAARRPSRPKTEIDRFAGVELTSIINMMDLEEEGALPLVDLDAPAARPGSRATTLPGAAVPTPPPPPSPVPRTSMAAVPYPSSPAIAPPLPPPQLSDYARPYGPPVALPPAARAPKPGRPATTRPLRGSMIPWIVVAAIVVAAMVAAIIIAMSGPDVAQ